MAPVFDTPSVSDMTPETSPCPSSCPSPDPFVGSNEEAMAMTPATADPIAIVGFSLRFPGEATSVEAFWDMLMDARCAATEFPKDRLNHEAFYSEDSAALGTIRPKKAHFVTGDLGAFDAPFFSMNAAEAAAMDPQQRGLLETTYRALENAGIPLEKISGTNASVHTGYFTADFMLLMGKDPEQMPKYAATGVAGAMLSNRISSFFNLLGPSVTLDTACSSSLVALDLACQAIRDGQSSLGIVAGANLMYTLDLTIGLSNMGFLSPDGVCHSFDHRANGYARGEGFGVVIIKPLSDAIRDGDTIRAIVRSTGSNQDGKTGLAQPSKEAQARLIADCYQRANLDRGVTRFVEAHGTGTALGDPLEAMAIGTSFDVGRPRSDPLYIGALKANFGHLEGTSGIAGLIKSVLVLERGIIPPIAGLEKLNPEIDAEFLNIKFPTQAYPWPTRGLRRASVNSFGFGGTNSHAVLDDAYHYMRRHGLNGKHCTVVIPPDRNEINDRQKMKARNSAISFVPPFDSSGPKLLVWSAADEDSLKRLTASFSDFFAEKLKDMPFAEGYLKALAYTLSERRTLLSYRSFAVVDSMDQLTDLSAALSWPALASADSKLGFVFTGQGAQWCGMGRALFVYPVFRNSVRDAADYLRTLGCDWWLEGALTGDTGLDFKIDEPRVAQPICTVLQVALIDLLSSLGITPSVVVGHSSGEIGAAYAAGALSRESAWKLAYYRGFFSSKLAASQKKRGAMISIGLSESDVQPYLEKVTAQMGDGDMTVACINSPKNVTVSGCIEHLEALRATLEEQSVFARLLKVPVAYHGPHMQGIAGEYLASITDITLGKAALRRQVTMISSVTGQFVTPLELCSPEYWVQNLVSPVRFLQAIQQTCSQIGSKIRKKLDLAHRKIVWANDLLEIGPHSTLSGPIRDILKTVPHGKQVVYGSVLVRNRPAVNTLMEAVGRLHCRGYEVEISRLNLPNGLKKAQPLSLPDLPEYTFNHSQSYWDETRISKNMRFRSHKRNGYCGVPVPDWNPLEARWRHFLKPNDPFWLPDHKINGTILMPAAGMIVMAIEAAAQLAGDAKIRAFEVRDATFHSALAVPPESDGVETQLHLRPHNDASSKSSSTADFQLYVYQSDSWAEVCRGTIRTIFSDESANAVDNASEEMHMRERATQRFADAAKICTSYTEGDVLYNRLRDCGYHFGPSFLRMQNAKFASNGEALAEVEILSTEGRDEPRVVHPATLDGILQIMLPGITDGGNDSSFTTSLPTRIDKIWVSTTGLLSKEASHVDAWVSIKKKGFRMTESSIMALSKENGSLKVAVEGIETTAISDGLAESSPLNKPAVKRLCWDLVYKPDITCLDKQQVAEYVGTGTPRIPLPDQYYYDLELLLAALVKKALNQVSESEINPEHTHLQKQYRWLQERLQNSPVDPFELDRLTRHQIDLDLLCERVRACEKKESDFYIHMLQQLTEIFQNKVDALEVMFQGTYAKDFYDGVSETADYVESMKNYLDMVAHKKPSLKILEVGAGTGSTTELVLNILTDQTSNGRSAKYSNYTFTDISQSFFPKAQELFEEYPKMDYKVLDIEVDPTSQSFEENTYDIIVASNVLHATRSIDTTLKNVRKLLKPGGQLVLVEVTNPTSMRAGSVFGLLPGWWLSTEHFRANSPAMSVPQWNEMLAFNGFRGADFAFYDHKNEQFRLTSMIIATVADNEIVEEEPAFQSARIITPSVSVPLVDATLDELHHLGIADNKVISFEEATAEESLEQKLVVVIDPIERPVLQHLDQEKFADFHSTMKRARNVVWVTERAENAPLDPSMGAINGLARTLRSEDGSVNFTTLLLNQHSRSPEMKADKIHHALRNAMRGIHAEGYETEFVDFDGVLNIPRAMEADKLNHRIAEQTSELIPRNLPFGTSNLRLTVGTPGLLDSLYFRGTPAPPHMLASNEIEVSVKAVGVNFKDCLVALGRVTDDTLGTECAGIVERAGKDCILRPGDRVVVSDLDVYRGTIRCNEALAAKIPDDMPFIEGAKLATNFVTAYHALVELGRIQAGEAVLIHAGAGGTGQAAIQISQYYGAEVFVTVGSEPKKDLVKKLYGIPDDHILYSRDTSFAQGIKRLTGGRGVDLILNSLAGDELMASWECIAPYGRFLEIGKRDIFAHGKLPMYHFAQNVSFSAIDIAAMTKERPALIQRALKGVIALAEKKAIHVAHPLKTFSLHQIEDAFRYLQSGKNSGGVVIDVDPEAIVPTLVEPTTSYNLSQDATYLIAGGLGGQGRSIIRWMTTRGAKHFLVLSRQGASTPEAKLFVQEMLAEGINIQTPACDISNRLSLVEVLRTAKATMPPIKGCIQAAMALRDSLFSNMTADDWKTATKPKIQGSWNLHMQLPHNLDFFILLSSASGIIGSGGQSNYAAGNTYQDALARYRHARGEKAVALDLSVMDEEGYLANHLDIKEQFLGIKQLLPMSQRELFAVLDYYCNPALTLEECTSQVVMGLELPANVRQKGLEEASWMSSPMFAHLHELQSTVAGAEGGKSDAAANLDINFLLKNVSTAAEAGLLVANGVRDKLAKILSRSSDEIDISRPMHIYGVDSLVAVELRNWFLKTLKADVAIFEILGGATMEALGFSVAEKLKSWE